MEITRVTSTASPPVTITARPNLTTQPALLQARDSDPETLTNCDGWNIFTCPTGTCYTGYNGYIGCCSVSDCRVRTTCYGYSTSWSHGLNPDTDGVVLCTNPNYKSCVTVTNTFQHQYAIYCDTEEGIFTTSYTNLNPTGSLALLPGQTAPPKSTAAASSSSQSAESTSSQSAESTSSQTAESTSSGVSLISSKNSQASSSATSSLSISGPNTTQHSVSLSGGAIAGIAIGAVAFAAFAVFLTIRFLFLSAKKRSSGSKYPRGTLGGATLLNSWPDNAEKSSPGKDTTSGLTSPTLAEKGKGSHHHFTSPKAGSVPWGPDDISSIHQSPELDSHAMQSPELDSWETPHQSPELDSHEMNGPSSSRRSSTTQSLLDPLMAQHTSSHSRRSSNHSHTGLPCPDSDPPVQYARPTSSSPPAIPTMWAPPSHKRMSSSGYLPQGPLPYSVEEHDQEPASTATTKTDEGVQHPVGRDGSQILSGVTPETQDKGKQKEGGQLSSEAVTRPTSQPTETQSPQPSPSINISSFEPDSAGNRPPMEIPTSASSPSISATGSWYGYLSPEQALAHGIPGEGEEQG